jgi:hypothetical protein
MWVFFLLPNQTYKYSCPLLPIVCEVSLEYSKDWIMMLLTFAGVINPAPFFRSFSYTSILGFPFVEPADLPSSLPSRTRSRVSSCSNVLHVRQILIRYNEHKLCLNNINTLSRLSRPMELSSPSPRASYRIARAAFEAREREIFPLCFGAAWPIKDAW